MIPFGSPELQAAYARGQTGALAVPTPAPGLLTARGASRLDLMQRMSTNELVGIEEGEVRPTILTTAIGRIVDRVLVLPLGDRLMVVTTPGRGEIVLAWLRRHIFFQDDVSLEPADPLPHHWYVIGPEAGDAIRRGLETDGPPAGRGFAFAGGLLWPTLTPEPAGVHLLLESSTMPALEPGGESVESAAAQEAYQALRIEAGFPEFGRDFDEGDIPLEVGLRYAVSFSKGCYLGQEIIARMESRARTPRRLVGARLPGAIQAPMDFPLGRLTSTALSPRWGWIGLAVVRPEALKEQIPVGGNGIELLELPFPRG